jgi:hypothetical protein
MDRLDEPWREIVKSSADFLSRIRSGERLTAEVIERAKGRIDESVALLSAAPESRRLVE